MRGMLRVLIVEKLEKALGFISGKGFSRLRAHLLCLSRDGPYNAHRNWGSLQNEHSHLSPQQPPRLSQKSTPVNFFSETEKYQYSTEVQKSHQI